MSPAAPTRLRVAVAGATGRMGRELIAAVLAAPDLELTGALAHAGDAGAGRDAGAAVGMDTGVTVTTDVEAGLSGAQVLIDFTRPEGSVAHLRACHALGVPAVIGTTGFSAAQHADIVLLSQQIGVVLAPNMSPGVHAVMALLGEAAGLLGSDHDIEIVEAHHRHKVDAPSGTALKMGQVIAAALGRELDDCAVMGRRGTGARQPGSIGYASVRGGDIVGDHTVVFAGNGERIEITHRSSSRQPYADGALLAARFVVQQRHGLFGMAEVLARPSPAVRSDLRDQPSPAAMPDRQSSADHPAVPDQPSPAG